MVNFIKRPQDWDAPESCPNCGEGIDGNSPHYRNLNTGRAYCTECGTMFDPWQVRYYDRGEDEQAPEVFKLLEDRIVGGTQEAQESA